MTLANVSEIRTKINPFFKQVQKGEKITFLRYGKPLAVLVNCERLKELEKLEKELKEINKKEAKKSLDKICDNFKKTGADKEWLARKGFKKEDLTDEQILDLVTNG